MVFETEDHVKDVLTSALYPTAKYPLSKPDDLYALGITVWEIYTERTPFDGIDSDFLEDVVAAGFQPNMSAVREKDIRALIMSFLKEGNLSLPEGGQYVPYNVCVTGDVAYEDCTAVPPHTYEKTVHREGCLTTFCEESYLSPIILSHIEKKICSQCLL